MPTTDPTAPQVRALIAETPTAELRDRLAVYHKRKLMDGLIVPGRREQLDTLIGMIQDELKVRGGADA